MGNSRQDFQIADKVALTLLESEIKRNSKGAEIPENSRLRLRQALDLAYREAIKAYHDNPSIDFSTAIYMRLRAYLEQKSQKEGPLIFFVPETIRFNRKREMQSIKVLLIQPEALSIDHFNQKHTLLGKLLIPKPESIEEIKEILRQCISVIQREKADFVCLPELCFINDKDIEKEFITAASESDSFIIAGSFHDESEEANICLIFCPNGQIVKQRKLYRSKELGEGIKMRQEEALHIIDYGQGRFSVLICIDAEAEAIRDVLKERLFKCQCPELIFNPSFTKTKARSHSQLVNLMSLIFAAVVFCNESYMGGSFVLYPAIELKDGKFKMCELRCCPTENISESVTVDISKLQAYKKAKIRCLISMKQ